MIGVAGNHENNARMTRTIYNALANRGYLMTRIRHHYSHDVQTDAPRASRHSQRRRHVGLYATSLQSQRKRCWPRLPFTCIRGGRGGLAHGPSRIYVAFSCTVLMHCICSMRLPGHRCAPHCREAGGAQFGSCRIRRPVPVQAERAASRSRCYHASRTPLSGGGAWPQGVESSTHSKGHDQRATFRLYPGGTACRVASAPGELTPARSRACVAGPGLWPRRDRGDVPPQAVRPVGCLTPPQRQDGSHYRADSGLRSR